MALTKIGTDGIKDDAVTTDKVANAINSSIAANTAKDLTALSASNLTSGTIPDARFPATLPAASAANLTAVPAANITGTLPAISGANLTNLPASGKATNLIINGAMNVAQRGTSSTDNNFASVDRFKVGRGGTDEAPTQAQVDVASGTTPYTLGFRKALKVTNGNQTSGAGAADLITVNHRVEAQNIAQSGWNYVSASSNITFSFWVKSSVAQNFYFRATTSDGTSQNYPMETGSLSADTWTKITKTIPGNSNITINNDNGIGLEIDFALFLGTDYTGSVSLNQWAPFSASTMVPDSTSTWYTTNDATFEITGVLLEVGDSASDYPHISYADELLKCYRYYYRYQVPSSSSWVWMGQSNGSDKIWGKIRDFPVQMRATPTCTIPSGGAWYPIGANSSVGGHSPFNTFNFNQTTNEKLFGTWSGAAGIDTDAVVVFANTVTDYFDASAEL